jgi:hypothetical protein
MMSAFPHFQALLLLHFIVKVVVQIAEILIDIS